MAGPNEEAMVRCETTAGSFTMKFYRSWAPNGYDRAVELFERKFYDESYFFRVVPNFLVQFGISYIKDKEIQKLSKKTIPDDPSKGIKFNRGTIAFAGSGPNSRSSHLFIAYGSIKSLGTQLWETAVGEVIEGMDNVENLYSYGDMPPWGNGPPQGKVYQPGFMEENFPKSDKFLHCKVERMPEDNNNMLEAKAADVVKKSDRVTDEEEFANARKEAAEIGQQRDLRPVEESLHEIHHEIHKEQLAIPYLSSSEEEKWMIIGGLMILGVMALIIMLVGRNKKVGAKTN